MSIAKGKLGSNANKVIFLQGDINKEQDCKRIYEEIDKRYNRLYGLVNSAGMIKFKSEVFGKALSFFAFL